MLEIISDCKIRLQQALDFNNMKAIDLAERLHISRSTVSQWLSGKTKPKRDRLVEIAEILSVDPSWLMGLDVPMKKTVEVDYLAHKITNDEYTLIEMFRKLDDDSQRSISDMVKRMYTYAEMMKKFEDGGLK